MELDLESTDRPISCPLDALRRLSRLPRPAYLYDGRSGWVLVTAAPDEAITVYAPEDPFEEIDRLCSRQGKNPNPDPHDPGWIGYLTYEAGRAIERVPGRIREEDTPPRMYLARYKSAYWWHRDHGAHLSGDPKHSALLQSALQHPLEQTEEESLAGEPLGTPVLDMDPRSYNEAFRVIAEAIAAGDVYQVNLTCAVRGVWSGHPMAFHKRLLASDPPPWAGYLDSGDAVISSNSPELLLTYDVSSRHAVSGPIKGTVPRGRTPEEEESLAARLCRDPKERAEHVMIVDLVRNDLGRVCDAGTIKASPLMRTMRLAQVQHMVTDVSGRLSSGYTAIDLLRAVYPGGSVTGAPKVAAMSFIDAVERSARGVYCGALGRVSPAGDLSLALPIRTATLRPLDAGSWTVSYGAGGGIVADSRPDSEYEELKLKARRVIEVLGG